MRNASALRSVSLRRLCAQMFTDQSGAQLSFLMNELDYFMMKFFFPLGVTLMVHFDKALVH